MSASDQERDEKRKKDHKLSRLADDRKSQSLSANPADLERFKMRRNMPDFLKKEETIEFEAISASKEVQKDPLAKQVLLFPKDDVEIVILKKEWHTDDLPTLDKTEQPVKRHIQDCIDFYSGEWKTVKRNYEKYLEHPTTEGSKLSTRVFEMKMDEQEEGNEAPKPDNIDKRLLAEYKSTTTNKENAAIRAKDRVDLFQVLNSPGTPDLVATKHQKFDPYTEKRGMQILVEFKKLSFKLGEIEPFFGIIAAYDMAKRKKISENAYFDLNSPEISALLGKRQGSNGKNFNKGILSITYPSTDVYLVLRIEKVLQGEVDQVTEPYVKFNNVKDKERDKLKSNAKDYCSRLGQFRQPFCWAMLPLFGEDKKLLIEKDTEFKALFRQKTNDISDQHFMETVNEYTKNSSTKRSKMIPGSFIIDLTDISETPAKDIKEKCIALQEFPQLSSLTVPHLKYVNNLYLYPEMVNFNNRGGSVSARNIVCRVQFLDSDENPNAEGLKRLYYYNHPNEFVSEMFTSVTYHNKLPSFYDEIKVNLPPQLNEQHHIKFTFFHVTCQPQKLMNAKTKEDKQLIGYAILKVYQNNKILDKESLLPVCMDLLPGYLSPDVESTLKFVDGKKGLFKLRSHLVSSIYSTDNHLSNFFTETSKEKDAKLAKAIQGLCKMKPQPMIQFLPIVFNQIFRVMCTIEEQSFNSFVALTNLLQCIYSSSLQANELLASYVDYTFENPAPVGSAVIVADKLCEHWVEQIKKTGDYENTIKFAWFLLQVVYKSMALDLNARNLLGKDSSRNVWFHPDMMKRLKDLIDVLIWEVQQRTKTGVNLAKDLNKSLGIFIRNLFSITDRGNSLRLAKIYSSEIAISGTDLLIELKIDFIKTLVEYEHYVPLNIPLPDTIDAVDTILETFGKKHYLCGILLKEIGPLLVHKERTIRMKSICLLKNLLDRHDKEQRYQEKKVKERVASMYFPLIFIIMDSWEGFQGMSSYEDKRNLLACFLWVLKNVNGDLLSQWWRKETQARIALFFDTLGKCIEIFEYTGEDSWCEKMSESKEWKSTETKQALENFYTDRLSSGGGKYKTLREKRADARRSLENRKMSDAATKTMSPLMLNKLNRSTPLQSSAELNAYDDTMEGNLSSETSFIVLDVTESFIATAEAHLNAPQAYLEHIFSLLLTILRKNQSSVFLAPLYDSLRAFVSRFAHHLFDTNTTYVAELCQEIVRHCNSSVDSTRVEASALLYLLLKKNYEVLQHNLPNRVKIQTTIAISKLVGQGIKSAVFLRRSLATIAKYALLEYPPGKGKGAEQAFARQVEELTVRLYTILSDSIKINQHSDDPEMMEELYCRIAKGYTNAPDLRVAWLESLAILHVNHTNWAEASMCMVHISAMIAEYLNLLEPTPGLPQGCSAFQKVSLNAVEEASLADMAIDEEGICETHIFSESGLLRMMREAVKYMKRAELYETCNDLYNLMMPVYAKNRTYGLLASCHADLADIFTKIINSIKKQTRYLGSYYRVGFYGSLFGEDDGKEYIYKEPKLTRLGEIQDKLTAIFTRKHGSDQKLKIHTDASAVDRSKLDTQLCYIQITSVTPYFEPWELKDRVTYYDRNYNINRFIFSSPFTRSGKSQAESIRDQCKRKTILTAESQFPYIKKRLLVVEKQELVLDPIQNAIETIQGRTDSISSELKQSPPNPKTLQGVLQGSVLLQVHAGPSEMCKEFLGKAQDFEPELVDELRQSLREFLKACEDAVPLNKTLIGPDQVKFQAELELGLASVKSAMEPFL